MRTLACVGILLVAVGACAPPPPTGLPVHGKPAVVVDAFAPGARVEIKSRSGTYKPVDTGHSVEVNASPGKTGSVVSKLGESVRVRFDAQTWDEFPPNGVTVQLPAFEGMLHESYLGPED